VSRHLEVIFLQNNRREIKLPEPEPEVEEEQALAQDEGEGDNAVGEKRKADEQNGN